MDGTMLSKHCAISHHRIVPCGEAKSLTGCTYHTYHPVWPLFFFKLEISQITIKDYLTIHDYFMVEFIIRHQAKPVIQYHLSLIKQDPMRLILSYV